MRCTAGRGQLAARHRCKRRDVSPLVEERVASRAQRCEVTRSLRAPPFIRPVMGLELAHVITDGTATAEPCVGCLGPTPPLGRSQILAVRHRLQSVQPSLALLAHEPVRSLG